MKFIYFYTKDRQIDKAGKNPLKAVFAMIIYMTLFHTASAQQPGRLWLMGYDEFPGVGGYGHALVRLLDDTVQAQTLTLAFNFESTVAVMSDPDSNLLFYTNGCAIADRQHQLMPNGAGLNPGDIGDLVCPRRGYIVPQGAMALPDPGNPERYFLLHTGASHDPVRKLRLGPLYYSVVDMTLRNGLGDVTSKNNLLLNGDLGTFTAVRHANGRDWWIIVPEFGNAAWHTFLIEPKGFREMPSQTSSPVLPGCEKFIGTAASLQGDRIAIWGDCKVTVLDFDRCAGTLSRLQELPAPTHWIPGGGVAFSPAGRYLYVTSQNVLFRADMQAASPRLDTVRFSYDPLRKSPFDVPGNTFHSLATGPDGHVYGNVPSRARHLHVLYNPDSDTIAVAALDFRPRGVALPVTNVRTLPHLPNYRLHSLPGSPCDTLGIVGIPELPNSEAFSIRPNPVQDFLLLDYPDHSGETLHVILYSYQGGQVRNIQQTGGQLRINTHDMPAGVYVLRLWKGEKYVGSKRILHLGGKQ